MATQRVFVIWTHPLFRDTVCLLLSHPLVELVGTTNDHSAAREQIHQTRPNVVIIEQIDGEELASEETVAILQQGSKVVRLSLADNELRLYLRELPPATPSPADRLQPSDPCRCRHPMSVLPSQRHAF